MFCTMCSFLFVCMWTLYMYIYYIFMYILFIYTFIYLFIYYLVLYLVIIFLFEHKEKEGFHVLAVRVSAVGITCRLPCQSLADGRGRDGRRSLAASPRPLLGYPQEGSGAAAFFLVAHP